MRSPLNRLKSDETLILAYQRGDVTAFEELYHRHKDGLYAFLYRSCPRWAVVEELAQDSWAAVVDSIDRYRPEARFRTWLYQIAHNRQVDHWRRRDNRHGSIEDIAEPAVAESDSDDQRRLLDAIGVLPREQKDALLLQEQGFSLSELAAITGAGEETVKSRLRYARTQLRALLEDES
jgi:RNA polymerase sigma-70 factor (ECF subfamily)